MINRNTPHIRSHVDRAAFTLVEMLVATALVMLIMLMFAQIYATAVGSVTRQRGVSNNDQKARQFDTVLRRDLQSMTYRQPRFPYGDVQGIVPMAPGDEPIIDPVNQRGYFYYSENNPLDQTDDVLQFTILTRFGERGDAESKNQRQGFAGKAVNLDTNTSSFQIKMGSQPDADDGISGNDTGLSRAAEVVYFLRNGNLYRRQFLLRDPQAFVPTTTDFSNNPVVPTTPTTTAQPIDIDHIPVFSRNRPIYAPNNVQKGTGFYDDFDYAATRVYLAGTTLLRPSHLWFHSLDSLSNHLGESNNSIGLPWNRFGFLNQPQDLTTAGRPAEHHGNPREYADLSVAPPAFMGRFTHEETSDVNFLWPDSPQALSLGRNDRSNDRRPGGDSLTNGTTGTVVSQGNALRGPRVGEDILLTKVESFDVEIFDHIVGGNGAFVNLGEPDGPDADDPVRGPLPDTELFADGTTLERRRNVVYGPWIFDPNVTNPNRRNRVFDTWHPSAKVFDPLNSNPPNFKFNQLPPYRPLKTDSVVTFIPANNQNNKPQQTGYVWRATFNPDGTPVNPAPPPVNPNTDVYFPLAGEDQQLRLLNNNLNDDSPNSGTFPLDAYADRNGNGVFDFPGSLPNTSLVAIPIGRDDTSLPWTTGSEFPEWPLTPGAIVQDGNIIWRIEDNRIGIRGIRITIRFKDQRTDLPRQLTIAHSFVE